MLKDLPEKAKFKRLLRRLSKFGETRVSLIGRLELLWRSAKIETPTATIPGGCIGAKFTNADIAIAVDWEHDEDALVEALVECNFLDEHEEFRLVVRNFRQHADSWIHAKVKRHRATGKATWLEEWQAGQPSETQVGLKSDSSPVLSPDSSRTQVDSIDGTIVRTSSDRKGKEWLGTDSSGLNSARAQDPSFDRDLQKAIHEIADLYPLPVTKTEVRRALIEHEAQGQAQAIKQAASHLATIATNADRKYLPGFSKFVADGIYELDVGAMRARYERSGNANPAVPF